MSAQALAIRRPGRLRADSSRVLAQLFVPGHQLAGAPEGRASGVVDHILALSEREVSAELASLTRRFADRHRDISEAFLHHADRIGNRLEPGARLTRARRELLGAAFTQEFAVEGAALCNPSAVVHPDQTGVRRGSLRFLMSVRQIGEGHRSTIGFRSGVVDRDGAVKVDEAGRFATAGAIGPGCFDSASFRGLPRRAQDAEAIGWVVDRLGDRFTIAELEARITQLEAQRDTRRDVARTVRRLRDVAARTYCATFPATSALGERVLHPATAVESNGMEDARWVRFVDDAGAVVYYATYTAYDGTAIVQQLLETTDFTTFAASPLLGPAAANKGLALFPRRVGGRYAALSRWDGAGNAVAFSDHVGHWPTATPIGAQPAPWEAVQVGNCGPPIETPEGWLVLTHGVGPMRTYSIGAMLLDLDDPTRLIGHLSTPLLAPDPDEQDGYVPNVVYSCGAVCHGSVMLIPYGIGDASIGFATASVPDLVAALTTVERRGPTTATKEPPMGDRAPQKPSAKKPGKSLKEKRETKKAKKETRKGLGS